MVVIGSYYGAPFFLRRFGVPEPSSPNGYVIPAEWQSALSNGSSAGGILGLLLNGWAADRYGPKIVMQVALVALTGFIFIFVSLHNTSCADRASQLTPGLRQLSDYARHRRSILRYSVGHLPNVSSKCRPSLTID